MTITEHTKLVKLEDQITFLFDRKFVSPYLMEQYLIAKKALLMAKQLIRNKYTVKQKELWA